MRNDIIIVMKSGDFWFEMKVILIADTTSDTWHDQSMPQRWFSNSFVIKIESNRRKSSDVQHSHLTLCQKTHLDFGKNSIWPSQSTFRKKTTHPPVNNLSCAVPRTEANWCCRAVAMAEKKNFFWTLSKLSLITFENNDNEDPVTVNGC